MRFRETIARMNRAKNNSRVRRRESNRSSHEPTSRSKVTVSNKNSAATNSIAGSTPGRAAAAPSVMEASQQTDATAEKSAKPSARPMTDNAVSFSGKRSIEGNSKLDPHP